MALPKRRAAQAAQAAQATDQPVEQASKQHVEDAPWESETDYHTAPSHDPSAFEEASMSGFEEVSEDFAPARIESAQHMPTPATVAEETMPTAVNTSSTALASAMSVGTAMQDAANAGFEGLELEWNSFPIIILKNGQFTSRDGIKLGQEFSFKLVQTSKVVIFKNGGTEDEEDFVYSYPPDGKSPSTCTITTAGEQLESVFAKWRSQGFTNHVAKSYLSAAAEITTGDMEGEIASLSIPPSSVGRFSSLPIRIRRAGYAGQEGFYEAVITATVGDEITKGRTSYNPWLFTVAKKPA